jgi:hypothetical protein
VPHVLYHYFGDADIHRKEPSYCAAQERYITEFIHGRHFRPPADTQAFDSHYFAVHVPVARKLPGLRTYEVSKGSMFPMNAAREHT